MLERYVAVVRIEDEMCCVEEVEVEVSGFDLEDATIEAGMSVEGSVVSIRKKVVECATEGCKCSVEVDEEYCFGCREFASSVAFGVRTQH